MLKYIVNVSIIVINKAGSIKVCLAARQGLSLSIQHLLINSSIVKAARVLRWFHLLPVHACMSSRCLLVCDTPHQQQPGLQKLGVPSFQHCLSQTCGFRATWRAEVLCEHRSRLFQRSLARPVLRVCALHTGGFQSEHWGSTYEQKAEIWNLWESTRHEAMQDCVSKTRARHRSKGLVESCSQVELRHPGHVEAAAAWWSAGVRSISFLSLSLSFCWVAAGDDERKLPCMVSLTSIFLSFLSVP